MIWMSPTSDWLDIQNKKIAQKDARIRGFRSFMAGLALDVSAFVIVVLVTAFTNIEWTREYWIGLAGLLAKTVLQASVAYMARLFLPPSNSSKL